MLNLSRPTVPPRIYTYPTTDIKSNTLLKYECEYDHACMQGCIPTCTEHFLHDFFLREKKSNDFKNVWRWNSGRQNSCFCCHIQGCLPISSWHFDSKRPRTDCGDLYQYLSAPKDSEDQEGALLYMLHDAWQSRGHENLLPAAIKELGRVRSTLEIPFKSVTRPVALHPSIHCRVHSANMSHAEYVLASVFYAGCMILNRQSGCMYARRK